MLPIKRMLVALDLSEIDEVVIRYSSYLSDLLEIDKVYFFHVAESLSLPAELVEKYPNLMAPADESLKDIIEEKVSKSFKSKAETVIHVREGNAEDKIIRWSDIKEIDLIVTGKKSEMKGSGLLPNKLARVGHCSVLMVPEKADMQIEKIMIPVDFSKKSKTALTEGMKLAKATNSEVYLQNTYKVPSGYHSSGKSYEEFAEIMKEHAEKDAREFLEGEGLADQCHVHLVLDNDNEPSDKIYQEAESVAVDLIVVASRGRTGLAHILLGSTADKLIQRKGNIPILVIKDKKENMGFLEALLKL